MWVTACDVSCSGSSSLGDTSRSSVLDSAGLVGARIFGSAAVHRDGSLPYTALTALHCNGAKICASAIKAKHGNGRSVSVMPATPVLRHWSFTSGNIRLPATEFEIEESCSL